MSGYGTWFSFISVSGMKYHDKNNMGEERVYLDKHSRSYSSLRKVKAGTLKIGPLAIPHSIPSDQGIHFMSGAAVEEVFAGWQLTSLS